MTRAGRTAWRVPVLALWAVSLAGAFLAGAQAARYRNQIRALVQSVQTGPTLHTQLYDLRVQKLRLPALGRDGGISPVADGILFVNRRGEMWFVDGRKALRPLSLRVPINVEAFETDPFNATTVLQDLFAVKGLLVQELPTAIRVLASYNYWYPAERCNTLRVAATELPRETLLSGGPDGPGDWTLVFETTPCYELVPSADGQHLQPTIGAGGRLAALSRDEILVSVGGFSGESARHGPESYWAADHSYGRTVRVNLVTGASHVFTLGHRNPQGLSVAADGAVWLTEHGARNGDELNHLVEGRNYGYPLVAYSTRYEEMTWPSNPRQERHDGYEQPTFVWTPSIGPTQVLVMEGDPFAAWAGDLLVASLRARSLFRLRLDGNRVVLVEPVDVQHRIRDMVRAADGTLVLKTDDNFLVYITPESSQVSR